MSASITDTRVVTSEAFWGTASAKRYMAQLCKHFAHKIPVTLNEHDGRIVFESGVCEAVAEETGLRLRVSAMDTAKMVQVQGIIIRHLQRFAFRDLTEEAAAAIAWVMIDASTT